MNPPAEQSKPLKSAVDLVTATPAPQPTPVLATLSTFAQETRAMLSFDPAQVESSKDFELVCANLVFHGLVADRDEAEVFVRWYVARHRGEKLPAEVCEYLDGKDRIAQEIERVQESKSRALEAQYEIDLATEAVSNAERALQMGQQHLGVAREAIIKLEDDYSPEWLQQYRNGNPITFGVELAGARAAIAFLEKSGIPRLEEALVTAKKRRAELGRWWP